MNDLRFLRRGTVVTVPNVPPSRTLLDVLREDLHCTGTKEGCGEGDCGACTVVVGEAVDGQLQLRAVNACIRLAHSVNGLALWTVEDLADATEHLAAGPPQGEDGPLGGQRPAQAAERGGQLHPVQQALMDHHASQCGFCTPGFAMSLFALYHATPTGCCASRDQAQQALSGNLCRCTGYRPILDAAQAMGALPAVSLETADLLSKLELFTHIPRGLEADFTYKLPTTLPELLVLRARHPQAQLVAGCTDVGLWVTKQLREFPHILDLSRVADLRRVEHYPNHIAIGAAVTLTDAFAALVADRPELAAYTNRFAGMPVRNSGTLGGNVANGSPIGDSMPLLIALGASVVLMRHGARGPRHRELTLEDLYTGYRQNVMAPDEVLAWIKVPKALHNRTGATEVARAAQVQERVWAYKVSKRQEDDISAVALVLRVELAQGRILRTSIGVGGVAATPARAWRTQAALQGQPWTLDTIRAAQAVLRDEFEPLTDLRASANYRRTVLGNLLQRAWDESLLGSSALMGSDSNFEAQTGAQAGLLGSDSIFDAQVDHGMSAAGPSQGARAPTGGSDPRETGERGGHIAHESAAAHVAGQARYIDDIPEAQGTLHAAPILSPHAHGQLRGIDTAPALALPGVVGVVLAGDIPGDPILAAFAHDEPVFAQDTVQYQGQVVGLVVARSPQQARRGARAVRLDIAPLPAILSVDDALAAQSYVLPPVFVRRGDADAALAQAPHTLSGNLTVGGQEHFYLEGQIAYALPQEQSQWLVHSSTQHPGEVQHWVAHALGLNSHAVRVECRRLGGGFGGKETQAGHVAVWAALAAKKFRAPVKLRLDRDDDFLITGKRHPFQHRFTVGFDATGRLCGLKLQMAANCGFSADLSGPVADRALFHADNAYYLQDVEIASYRCKTHTQSHTAFRGFGGPQGVILIEAILGDIARHLGLDPLAVRKRNLYSDEPAGTSGARRNTTHYGMPVEDNILPQLLSKLELLTQYQRGLDAVLAWNSGHTTKKRGLALTPVKFGISFTATLFNQAGALVHVYTDGSVQVNHGGIEMGQGLNTKVAQIVAAELGIAVARVLCTAADTSKVPNASATAASAGTDLNGRAAQFAARHVRDNLAAFVCGLDGCGAGAIRFEGGQVISPKATRSFDEVVGQAYANRIQLWSDGFYRTPKIHYDKTTLSGRPFYYFAYGAACTTVEIDTLTGESKVLKVDILHDVGRSINPALDIGQIEGAFVQGMGWLTTEQLVWDDQGHLATHAPSTYKIPTAGDVPEHFQVDLWPEPNREDNVGGSKAVGEPPFMLAISVFEALRDAIAQARGDGKAVRLEAPATPEHVLRALG